MMNPKFTYPSLVVLSLLSQIAFGQGTATPEANSPPAPGETPAAPPPAEASPKVERIQVTGSRLKRIDAEGATPVTVVSREEIDKTGAVNVRDLVQEFSGTTTSFAGGGSSVAGGVATVSLRGLGPERTLVLVDGVRLPKHPELAAVDLNTIPVAAIERVEILRQSASAIYGADAVGGVINIITRKNFNGSQVQVQANRPTKDGGASRTINATTGFSTDASSSVLMLSYLHQDILIAKDRDFSRERVSATGYPGTYSAAFAGTDADGNPTTNRLTFPVRGCPNYSEENGLPVAAGGCFFNYNDYNSLLPEIDRISGLYNFSYDLPNGMQFTAKIMASRQASKSQLRPEGSVGRDLSPVISQDVITGMSDERYNELFPGFEGARPTTGGVRLNLRLVDFGSSITEKEATLVGATTGLGGTFTNGWEWKVLANASGTKTTSESDPKFLLAETNAALASGELIPWASDFDLAGLRARLLRPSYYVEETSTYGLEAIVSGEIGSLPGGSIGLAFGASTQNEDYDVDWNHESTEGLLLNVAGAPGEGDREVVSAFAEASLPFTKTFEASGAVRLDSYSDSGSSFNPQLSLAYAPVEILKLRGSVGTAFKAPSLDDMHGATGVSFNSVVDYTYCENNGISRAACAEDLTATAAAKNVRRSNKDLEPEKSDIYSFGFVLQAAQDLSLTADYWKIRSRDLIDFRDLQDLVDENDPAVVRSPTEGVIEYIDLPIQNLSKMIRSGVDVGLDYSRNLPATLMTFRSLGTWYFEDKLQPAGKPEQNNLGTNGSFKWKLNNSLDFFIQRAYGLTLASTTFATHGKFGDDEQRLPQYTRYDLQTRYAGPWNGEIALGVNNLLNKQGGADDTNTGDVEQSIYDIQGREYYLRLTQNF